MGLYHLMGIYDLDRFVKAQDGIYGHVIAELSAGRKNSHWMWFIFPQFAGLGFTTMAQHYAIASRDEARNYLAHDVLGLRLVECTRMVLGVPDRSISEILGQPDDVKFRSSMNAVSFGFAAPNIRGRDRTVLSCWSRPSNA